MRFLKYPLKLWKAPIVFGLFLFTWALVHLFSRRPMRIRVIITLLVARCAYTFGAGPKARIKKNLSLIRPDLDEKTIARGAWRVTKAIARSWAAMIGNANGNFGDIKDKLDVTGIEPLLAFHKAKKKVIIVTGHVGPVDEIFRIVPLYGLRVYVPTEPVKPKWLLNLMMRSRMGFGDIILEPVQRKHTTSRARHHLSDGRIVVLAIDMIKNDGKGVRCRIGNGEAYFPVGAVKLALEEDATIFPIFPSWGKNGKILVAVGAPVNLVRTGNMARDIEINTRRLVERYGFHIQACWDTWLRALWAKLEPVGE